MDWYVSRSGEREGPFSIEQMRRLAELGKLQSDYLVWRPGMDQWKPLSEVPGILTPPPIDQFAVSHPIQAQQQATISVGNVEISPINTESTEVAQVRPWVRYWARMFDVYVFSFPVGIALGIFAPRFVTEKSNELVLGMLIVFLWVFAEALLLSVFGTTPGKWLLKVKIGLTSGESISFSQALNRSLKVWWRGLGTGFPIASLITLVIQHGRLTRNGITSWDREGDFSVVHEKIGVGRTIAVVTLFLLFFFFMIAANVA